MAGPDDSRWYELLALDERLIRTVVWLVSFAGPSGEESLENELKSHE
jgi:hypothetical protein